MTDNTSGELASFLTTNPNGSWSLFIADLSCGGVSTVQSWGLQMDIVAVPEVETWTAVVLLGSVAGCRGDAPTSSEIELGSPSLAKGGGGSGGSGGGGTAPTVSAVAPWAAVQDTTVEVSISGSGFSSGARAVW